MTGRPGPKGPAQELIDAVVEMKRRNPTWGCPRIAQQITVAFGVDIDKDVVRRILGKHYRPESGSGGPSWLTFLGQAKDSLWSADLFRCESLSLRTHLGAGGYGSVHSSHHRVWHSPRNCRWAVAVPIERGDSVVRQLSVERVATQKPEAD